jgi:hypothetical protein
MTRRLAPLLCGLAVLLIAAKDALIWRATWAQEIIRRHDYLRQGLAMRDSGCATPFCDFSLFWLDGRLARTGAIQALYDFPRYYAFTSQIITHQAQPMPFIYPPLSLPVMVLASLPPLATGYYLFVALSVVAAVLLLRWAGIFWACITIGLLSPAAAWAAYLGQLGLFCGAASLAGLALLPRRPIAGGVLLGLLCIKPQYAVLVPVVLLASRDRRAMLAGFGTMVALLCLSVIWFGWPAWSGFLGPGQAEIRTLMQAKFSLAFAGLAVSPFWLARSLGAGLRAASSVQAGMMLLEAAAAWYLWSPRRAINHPARIVMTICLAVLASPYVYTADLVGYAIALPLLARRRTPVINLVLALLWLAPAYAGHFVQRFGFSPMPFCIALTFGIAWRQSGAVDRPGQSTLRRYFGFGLSGWGPLRKAEPRPESDGLVMKYSCAEAGGSPGVTRTQTPSA